MIARPAKQLNRLRCHLGCGLGWIMEACVRWGTHWRHLANRIEQSRWAAMQFFVKILWPLVPDENSTLTKMAV